MKMTLALLSTMILSTSAFAKIYSDDGKFFIETRKGKSELMNVNEGIKNKSIKSVKLYGNGKANVISFSKDKGPEILYSVDEKGFIYSIKPFANYKVTNVDADGKLQFKEAPKRKYTVDSKGFFLY